MITFIVNLLGTTRTGMIPTDERGPREACAIGPDVPFPADWPADPEEKVERETRFELATFSLEG
jgi:hypothetical protein